MVMDVAVTRRKFLSGLMKTIAGTSLYSFLPVSLPLLDPAALVADPRPYWLDVLSKGIRFYPENITAFFSGWSEAQFLDSAQYALFLTLGQNKRALANTGARSDKEMDHIVENNKTTQYMFDNVKRAHLAKNADPQTTYGNDPFHARMLSDLSSFILRNIEDKLEVSSIDTFSDFDIMLLNSGTTYLEEAIRLSEHAYIFYEDNLKEVLRSNIGSYYNNLGLTLSYLGDIPQAHKVFLRALEFRPDDTSILDNIRDMDSKGINIRKGSYSHSLVE